MSVSINIPGFVEKVKEGDFAAAYQVISESSALPLSAVVSARRKASVKENVSVVIKGEAVSIGKLERL